LDTTIYITPYHVTTGVRKKVLGCLVIENKELQRPVCNRNFVLVGMLKEGFKTNR